jgi:tetratricopeptide (TPR) repeat protein
LSKRNQSGQQKSKVTLHRNDPLRTVDNTTLQSRGTKYITWRDFIAGPDQRRAPMSNMVDPVFDSALPSTIEGLILARRIAEATTVVQQALARLPVSASLLVEESRVFLATRDLGPALMSAERALAIDPRYVLAYVSRAAALRELRRFAEARESLQTGIELDSREPMLAVETGRIVQCEHRLVDALSNFDHALSLDANARPAWIGRIECLLSLRRFAEAEAAARAAIERRPEEPTFFVELGDVYARQRRYDEALAPYERALQIDPDHNWALSSRLIVLRQLRRFPEAEAAAQAAIEHRPGEPQLLVGLGQVYGDQYRYDEALAQYDRALQIDPDHDWALSSRLSVLRQLRRFPEAEAAAQAAVERRPYECRRSRNSPGVTIT